MDWMLSRNSNSDLSPGVTLQPLCEVLPNQTVSFIWDNQRWDLLQENWKQGKLKYLGCFAFILVHPFTYFWIISESTTFHIQFVDNVHNLYQNTRQLYSN